MTTVRVPFMFLALAVVTSAGWSLVRADEIQRSDPAKPGGQGTLQVDDVSAELEKSLLAHLQQHHQPAVEFVVNQFKKHDVVLLGEDHQIAENCRFVSSLIEPLYRNGVRTLAWEFTRSSFNDEVSKLVTADEFDDDLANQLLRRGPWPTWGYQEYVDILRAAWSLNHNRPAGALPFRIIALDSDWSQYELWFGNLDRMQSFQKIFNREKHMTKVLKAESFAKKEKALVHIGYAHTVTGQGAFMGKVLTDEFGARVKQVTLHRGWRRQDGTAPVSDLIERLAVRAGGGKPIGFHLVNSPLGHLADSSALVFRFSPKATLADVSQSYVYLNSRNKLHGVKWIPGFIVEENFEQARAIATKMKWIRKGAARTPEELDAALQQRFAGKRLR